MSTTDTDHPIRRLDPGLIVVITNAIYDDNREDLYPLAGPLAADLAAHDDRHRDPNTIRRYLNELLHLGAIRYRHSRFGKIEGLELTGLGAQYADLPHPRIPRLLDNGDGPHWDDQDPMPILEPSSYPHQDPPPPRQTPTPSTIG